MSNGSRRERERPRRFRQTGPLRGPRCIWTAGAGHANHGVRSARFTGSPLRIWTAGKAYRLCDTDAMHLEAFHQAEVLQVDEKANLDPWEMTARILKSVDGLFPGRQVKIVPTHFPMCTQAWELEVEDDGRWYEVLAWGVFTDRIVGHIGGDPAVHRAIGVGHGLERLAMLRYGIDDIRKIDGARVA